MPDTTCTAPGHLTARRTVPTTATEPATRPTATALSAPRLALMAQPQRPSPRSMTHTSIFVQWAAADRIDGGGRDLIRELEGR